MATMERIQRRADIALEVKGMFNDICIVGDTDLVRLIGFSSDLLDYYYICKHRDGHIVHHSCVGPCISLKNSYERYEYMEEIFHINHCPREINFIDRESSDEEDLALYGWSEKHPPRAYEDDNDGLDV